MTDRARGRTCSKCDYFDAMGNEKLKDRGICRINPPLRQWLYRLTLDSAPINVGWPMVNQGDWCARFQPALGEDGDLLDRIKEG